MLGIERRQHIVEALNKDKKVYVAHLSEVFQVAPETVRRDLEKLEKEGLLRRSYGGAVPKNALTNEDLPFVKRMDHFYEEKRRIAQVTSTLVQEGDSIMIDSSSTAYTLMEALKQKNNVTVITNSLRLLNDHISSGVNLIGTGGNLRAHSFAFVGEAACTRLKDYYADLAILSCKGIDLTKGVTESNEPESLVKKAMLKQAKTRILLVDRSKFDQIAFIHTCDLSDFDYVITGHAPRQEWVTFFKKNDITLLCSSHEVEI